MCECDACTPTSVYKHLLSVKQDHEKERKRLMVGVQVTGVGEVS